MHRHKIKPALIASAVILGLSGTTAAAQGKEVVIGTIMDLSGPVAVSGIQARNAMVMRVDAVNKAGGVNGRKIRLIVEDSGYDPKKSILAAQKLVQRDKVIAVVGSLGTPVVLSTMPFIIENGVLHAFPLAAQRKTFEPRHDLKFAMLPPYSEGMASKLPKLLKANGYKRIGIIYQDDNFGRDIHNGARDALKAAGLKFAEVATYKRGATDFSSQVARLQKANVDLVVLGTVVRETVGVVLQARKVGWNVDMVGSEPAHTTFVPKLGGAKMEGLYAIAHFPLPYPEAGNEKRNAWVAAYKSRFKEDPRLGAVMGYLAMDLFVRGLEKAGANPTAKTVGRAIQGLSVEPGFLGSPAYRFSPKSHVGSREYRIYQVRNGKWSETLAAQ